MVNSKKRPGQNKRAVSRDEKHRWLDQLDQGIGITEITRRAKRDIRIVKRQIEIARWERLISQVRRDDLLKKLNNHEEDLFSVVDRLESIVGAFPPVDLLPSEGRQQKLHIAFLDHVKQIKIYTLLTDYKQIVEKYSDELAIIKSKLALIEEELLKGIPVGVTLTNWSKLIIEAIESGVHHDKLQEQPHNQEKTSGDKYHVLWQANWLTTSPMTEVQANTVVSSHLQFIADSKQLLSGFPEYRNRLAQVGDDIRNELDSLRIRRLIPGHCEFCPF